MRLAYWPWRCIPCSTPCFNGMPKPLAPGTELPPRRFTGLVGGGVDAFLGAPILLANAGGVILMIMVSLIFMLLWRSALPVGMKFFGVTLLMNWAEYILMRIQAGLLSLSPIFTLSYRMTGYLAVFGIVLAIG